LNTNLVDSNSFDGLDVLDEESSGGATDSCETNFDA
jgi:hypothetical protein